LEGCQVEQIITAKCPGRPRKRLFSLKPPAASDHLSGPRLMAVLVGLKNYKANAKTLLEERVTLR